MSLFTIADQKWEQWSQSSFSHCAFPFFFWGENVKRNATPVQPEAETHPESTCSEILRAVSLKKTSIQTSQTSSARTHCCSCWESATRVQTLLVRSSAVRKVAIPREQPTERQPGKLEVKYYNHYTTTNLVADKVQQMRVFNWKMCTVKHFGATSSCLTQFTCEILFLIITWKPHSIVFTSTAQVATNYR